ncbi:carbohydrate-selective porin [Rhodoplanes sp. Z2-YC6860]|nr:carbohydrate-selective porin [Rhodoplanes sp. Z2-YC6860]
MLALPLVGSQAKEESASSSTTTPSASPSPPETTPAPAENKKPKEVPAAERKPITEKPPSEKPDPHTGKPKSAAKKDKEQEHEPLDPDTGSSTLTHDTLGVLPNPWTDKGVKFALSYVTDTLGNVSGGIRRQLTYTGRLNGAIDVDLARIAGWQGLSFHANVFQINGRGLSRTDIDNLMPVSSIEALATTRLYEAWFEQRWANDKYSVRAGQLAADAEFFTTRYSDAFINASYGWPAILAVNLPGGAPSPPLSSVGARFKAAITDQITILSAVFNGDPAGPGPDDPQSRDRYGLNFRINDPPLLLQEFQFAWNQDKDAKGLPGTFKLGGWYHAGLFNDQRFAANGLSQAAPGAAADPAQLRSDYGIYGTIEQLVKRFSGDDDARGIGTFLRLSTTPADRNLVSFYTDAGISIIGLDEKRPHDKIALGFAYARVSNHARDLDRDYEAMGELNRPVRDYEGLLYASYLAEIKTGWTMLPNFQYIIHPGGGYVFDNGVPKRIGNTAVIGVRSVLKF